MLFIGKPKGRSMMISNATNPILLRPSRFRGDEPGVEAIRGCVHKQRALNTRLSSGTSAGTFACPKGPYRNCRGEAGTKNEPKWYFVPVQKKGSKSRSSRFEHKFSLISFSRGSGPPLTFTSKRHDFWGVRPKLKYLVKIPTPKYQDMARFKYLKQNLK